MKWTDAQIAQLKSLCFDEVSNSEIAEYFGVPATEIHAKRSQLGITIPKVKAAKEQAVAEAEKVMNADDHKGLEIFCNAGELCIVLARSGDTALIVRPANGCSPFVVPLQHKPGASDWWQGRYFPDLESAYKFYSEEVRKV